MIFAVFVCLLTCGLFNDAVSESGPNADGCPLDVVFVLDGSGSVKEHNWEKVKTFVKQVANSIDAASDEGPKGQFGVVTFSNNAHSDIDFSDYLHADFDTAVNNLKYWDQNTNTSGGVFAAHNMFKGIQASRPEMNRIMMIVTDGVPTRDIFNTIPYVNDVRNDGIEVMSIGIGPELDGSYLLRLAGGDPSHSFHLEDFDNLNQQINTIIQAMCLPAQPITPVEGCPINLAFILDGSGSVKTENWDKIKTFVKTVAQAMDVSVNGQTSQFGVVTFGNRAHVNVDFGDSKNADFGKAVDGLPYLDQNTNTSGGIYVGHEMFAASRASRLATNDLMVIVTDGVPTWDIDLTIPYANEVRTDNIQVVSVGVGPELDKAYIMRLAGGQLSHTFHVNDFDNLMREINALVSIMCFE